MNIREVQRSDLLDLLTLYTELHQNPIPEDSASLRQVWEQIIKDKNHHIIVAVEEGKIVSSCVLVVIPNLTHSQRPYALIENVITSSRFRKRGFASACLSYARLIATKAGCYKIMLLTGSKQEDILHFYKNCGYNQNDKTAFIQWL